MTLAASYPGPGDPAGGLRVPIDRAPTRPRRAAQGKRAPRATRSGAEGHAQRAGAEHREHGEDATLPEASTAAFWSARWATTMVALSPLRSSAAFLSPHPTPSGS